MFSSVLCFCSNNLWQQLQPQFSDVDKDCDNGLHRLSSRPSSFILLICLRAERDSDLIFVLLHISALLLLVFDDEKTSSVTVVAREYIYTPCLKKVAHYI